MIEPNDHPVWAERARDLREWLMQAGPQLPDAIVRWAFQKGWNPTLLTNVLAWGDGNQYQHAEGQWRAYPAPLKPVNKKVAKRRAAPSAAERPDESESVGASNPAATTNGQAPAEGPVGKSHPLA